MKRRILTLIVIVTGMGIVSGCATTRPGFRDVQDLVRSRSKAHLIWRQKSADDRELSKKIHSMLKERLTVEAAVQIALLNNSSLQANYELLGISQADLIQAGLLENPIFEASVRFPDVSTEGTNTEFSVKLSLFDIFMAQLEKKVAMEQFEQVKLLVGNAVLRLATEVQSAYFRLQAGEQMLLMRKDVLKASKAANEFAKRQRNAGNVNELALYMQESTYHKATLVLDRHEQHVLVLKESLSRLMGLPYDETKWRIIPELPYISKSEPSLDRLQALALKKRLDLAAAQKEVSVVKKALEVARLGVMPHIDVGVNTEREPDRTQLTGPMFEVELPIFDQKQQPILRTKAQLRRSQKQLAALKRDVHSEVKLARSELMTSKKAVLYYEDTLVPLHGKIVELTLEQYNFMLHGTYELLLAKQEEINTRRDYIEALRDYWIARSDLERAVGSKINFVESEKKPTKKPKREMNHGQERGGQHEHGGEDV